MAESQRIPTVNDLRVKLCYICREEERYDQPEDPPRAWTHPCSCTLVAHESCLLHWIKSSQQDPTRAATALKCPQCGATYELESDNPLTLRILDALNGLLSTAGKSATVLGASGVAASFGCAIYIIATRYGAFAVREFLGPEMYNILLSDDPSKWPWHAFVHLPLIPFSLVLSRTRLFDRFPLLPLFLTWSSSPPVANPNSPLWAFTTPSPVPYTPPLSWPPTPLMCMIFLPFIRTAYRRFFARLTKYVLGTPTDPADTGPIRRIVWALNDDGPAPLRVRIGANIEPPAPNPGAPDAPAGEPNDPPEDAAAVAERTLHITTSSIGRFVGGALLIPTLSSRMGSLLFRLSRRSPWLRAVLAIRERPAAFNAAFPSPVDVLRRAAGQTPAGADAGFFAQLGRGLATGLNVMCSGTPTWNAHDPVWWRNAVGLGMFVFARDCVHLLHVYLTRRELESRKVRNRSFAGVDIRELDLIDSPREPTGPTTTTDAQPSTSAQAQGEVAPEPAAATVR